MTISAELIAIGILGVSLVSLGWKVTGDLRQEIHLVRTTVTKDLRQEFHQVTDCRSETSDRKSTWYAKMLPCSAIASAVWTTAWASWSNAWPGWKAGSRVDLSSNRS